MTKTINILLYGPPGTGKTTLACTAADNKAMGEVALVDFENGSMSVGQRISKGEVRHFPCKTAQDLEDLLWKIANRDSDVIKIKTLIIDSVTELQQLDLMHISEQAQKSGKRVSADELQQRDYAIDTTRLKRIFRMARDMEVNTVFIAHSKDIRNETKVTAIVPSLTDKLETTLSGFVDCVWFLGIDPATQERKMITSPTGLVRAKTRGTQFPEALGAVVVSPNIGNLYTLMLESEYGVKQ